MCAKRWCLKDPPRSHEGLSEGDVESGYRLMLPSHKFDKLAAPMGSRLQSLNYFNRFFSGVKVFCQEKVIYFILGHPLAFLSFLAFFRMPLSFMFRGSLLDTSFALEHLIQFCLELSFNL